MRAALLLAGICLALLWLGSSPARAATIDVACGAANVGDPATLVQAVTQANQQAGPDTIDLAAGCRYEFAQSNTMLLGYNALPPIGSTITIEGHGATIARNTDVNTPPFRFFFVGADPANPNTDGYTSPGPGDLTLIDVALQGGYAQGGYGMSEIGRASCRERV